MSKDARFWRNVTLIAIVHVALIAGLIRWCVEARSSSDAQSIVWLSGAEDLAAEEPDSGESAQPVKVSTPPPELKPDEAEKEQPLLTPAKSNCPHRNRRQHRHLLQSRLQVPRQRRKSLRNQHRNRPPKRPCWQKLLPNHRRKRNRVRRNRKKQRKPTQTQRKKRSRKPLHRKRDLHLRPAPGKQVQRAKVDARAAGAAHRNSAGMAICSMTVFTVHGFSQRLTSLRAPKFRRWSKFESKKTGAFPVSKSSGRPRTSW